MNLKNLQGLKMYNWESRTTINFLRELWNYLLFFSSFALWSVFWLYYPLRILLKLALNLVLEEQKNLLRKKKKKWDKKKHSV